MTTRQSATRPRYQDPAWQQAMTVRLDYNAMMARTVGKLAGFVPADLKGMIGKMAAAHRQIVERTGPGADYLGFMRLPYQDESDLARIAKTARRLAQLGDRHVVLGIGGSYLGARALIDALCDPLRNEKSRLHRDSWPRLYFEGNNLDPDSLRTLLEWLPVARPTEVEGDFTVNVISKSGTTLETAVAFRLLRQRLQQVYGKDYAKRIVATTDAKRGLTKEQADREGFESFVIPDDVGGRFSVLSPVGLLPAALAGVDIHELVAGARAMAERCKSTEYLANPAYLYASLQHLSEERGRSISAMVAWGKALEGVAMWYDQLCA
ncbi:MAG: glucose-6-phosphate isomerase, partial [Cyanobacteria bacterium REEB65]|nr:glucose-6-phosphate isomerase [Cyanobacteria bacterium REEB65]